MKPFWTRLCLSQAIGQPLWHLQAVCPSLLSNLPNLCYDRYASELLFPWLRQSLVMNGFIKPMPAYVERSTWVSNNLYHII